MSRRARRSPSGYAATRRGNRLGLVTFGDDHPRVAAGAAGPRRAARPAARAAHGRRRRGEAARGRRDLRRRGAQARRHAGAPALVRRRRSPTSAARATGAGRCSCSAAVITSSAIEIRDAARAGAAEVRRSCGWSIRRRAGSSGSTPRATGCAREFAAAAAKERREVAAEITSAGARHVVLSTRRRLAARPHRLPPARGRAVSFASPIALLRPAARAARRSRATCWFQRDAEQRGRALRPAGAAAERGRPRSRLAPAPARRGAAARRRRLPGRLRAAARHALGALRGGDGVHRDRHVALDGRDTTSRRRGSPPRRRRPGASSRSCPASTASPSSPSARGRRSWRRRRRTAPYVRCGARRAARRRGDGARRRDRDRRSRSRRPTPARPEAARRPPPPPAAILVLSDGAAGRRAASSWPTPCAGRARPRSRSSRRVLGHRRRASCRCRTSAATSSGSRCRRTPTALRAVAAQTGGRFFAAADAGAT